MVQEINDEAKYRQLWDELQLSILQSWEWGDLKQPLWQPLRLVVDDYPITVLLRKVPVLSGNIAYIPRPFTDLDSSTEKLNSILTQLIAFLGSENSSKHKLVHLMIDPELYSEESQRIFNELGFKLSEPVQARCTNLLSLEPSEEELLLGVRESSRRNIKKAVKSGCTVETHTTGDAIERFLKVMHSINVRNAFVKQQDPYFRKLWEISDGKLFKLFIVTHQGNDVATCLVGHNRVRLSDLYVGVTDAGKAVNAGHLMKWESILDAKRSGYKVYDHWGVAKLLKTEYEGHPTREMFDPKDKLAYLSEFKFSFGGEYMEYLKQQLYVFDNLRYQSYKLLDKGRVAALQISKRLR
ncbi:MAG: peptidoglycan bridge formation glycyltransferase FemA/FemB family protein [Candidatus Dojkabacteria bacterium]|nr:MAG: peptidoglycan bridge formation glycyltransferase FemA/FemB family protein [Candidatus Dojkabacteria bacterium]